MAIVIGADFIPTEKNLDSFKTGKINLLIGNGEEQDLLNIIKNADYRIFNLEGPLCNWGGNTSIKKSGPVLRFDTASINTYKALGVDLFTLANNHIMDHGVEGYRSTIKILDEAGIAHVGTGDNPETAAAPYYFKFQGKTVGVFACAEHEFSIVESNKPGANPVDYLETPDLVEKAKNDCDFLIVLYHGGKEFYRYPSPELQKVCRKLADKGADLILVQHTHCIGCEEKYNGSTIVYGQGNFLFDRKSDEYWDTGLLVSVEDDFSIRYYPLEKKEHGIKLSSDESIMTDFYHRSEEIKDPSTIEAKYRDFARKSQMTYLKTISTGESYIFKVLNKIVGGRLREHKCKKITNQQRLNILNALRCEAHRELFISGLLEDITK